MDYIKIRMEDLISWLKENLNKERYEHSIGTAECAKLLAQKEGLNEEKAYVAGLLHDCAKCFSTEKLLTIIDNENLDVTEDEKMNYKTLHAPVSAYVAQKEFGVEDSEILSAIRFHTIGKTDMSVFEKIIFLADKIEEKTREKEYSQPIIDCLKKDGINCAMLQCYRQTIKSLVDRDLKICPATIEIYNCLKDVK